MAVPQVSSNNSLQGVKDAGGGNGVNPQEQRC